MPPTVSQWFGYVLLLQDIWPGDGLRHRFHRRRPGTKSRGDSSILVMSTVRSVALVGCWVNSPSLVDALVARGAAPGRLGVLHNWVDEAVFEPGADAGHTCPSSSAGTNGPSVPLLRNLGFARGLTSGSRHSESGSYRQEHTCYPGRRCRAKGTPPVGTKVRQRPLPVPRRDTAAQAVEVMRGADWLVVLLNDTDLSAVTMPSKVPSSLAMGMPVVATVTGDRACR